MFQLKLQEFEFIRKSAENIFFVAHRQRDAGPMHSGSALFFILTAKSKFGIFFATSLHVAASCISLAATFLQKSPVRVFCRVSFFEKGHAALLLFDALLLSGLLPTIFGKVRAFEHSNPFVKNKKISFVWQFDRFNAGPISFVFSVIFYSYGKTELWHLFCYIITE